MYEIIGSSNLDAPEFQIWCNECDEFVAQQFAFTVQADAETEADFHVESEHED